LLEHLSLLLILLQIVLLYLGLFDIGIPDFTITITITRRQGRMKYHVQTESGRDFIMETDKDVYTIAYEAYEEACLMDDYLVNITPICDV
jgi:hypothetical protein